MTSLRDLIYLIFPIKKINTQVYLIFSWLKLAGDNFNNIICVKSVIHISGLLGAILSHGRIQRFITLHNIIYGNVLCFCMKMNMLHYLQTIWPKSIKTSSDVLGNTSYCLRKIGRKCWTFIARSASQRDCDKSQVILPSILLFFHFFLL